MGDSDADTAAPVPKKPRVGHREEEPEDDSEDDWSQNEEEDILGLEFWDDISWNELRLHAGVTMGEVPRSLKSTSEQWRYSVCDNICKTWKKRQPQQRKCENDHAPVETPLRLGLAAVWRP